MSAASEEVQKDLDAEFRQILYIIKPYIAHINDHFHLEKYRVWLERLSESSTAEKFERNKYLVELANQIHDNALKPPFTFGPPRGPLPKLRTFQKEELEEWPYISPRRPQHADPSKRQEAKDASPQKKKHSKTKTISRPFQKLGKVDDSRINSDTSSWCDLTESGTSVNLGCGDTDLDEDGKKLSSQHKKEGLKLQEHFMKKYEEESNANSKDSESCSIDSRQFMDTTEEINSSRKPTEEEVEALKLRMKDLLEVKNALRDTHCLTEDRKKTIDNLQIKLKNAEKQNAELKSQLDAQKKKITEMEKLKNKEIYEFKEKFTHLRQKEIEFLKQYHKDEIQEVEKSHSSRISVIQSEIKEKIEAVKKEYEEKIKKLDESSAELLKEKDEEICRQVPLQLHLQNKNNPVVRLRSEIKAKEGEPPDEQNSEQIISLKKCISKLDRVLHKNEKDYVKKIEKLKQELEVRDMTTQVQLRTQRADLIVRNTAAKQEELKNALNSLEGKYKKMMETLQLHALEAKKHDEKLIHELRALLDKHNIVH
ncbi:intracellular protein transport protein USO1-like [Asbolus verrucosus]|uniref:Intracellular protein transport protein USO1-like n=1 Tax=Asbolus verrucosus TaxID=1661398 RepID=A0A482VTL4_ASBVE|nr:intracellular protein transport protein USO1-like [Asbolus verrucosus]